MPDENMISPHAFSSCELIVKIDGNELNIPINFCMSDSEIRKLYPHLLTVSRIDDNPMMKLLDKKDAGEFSDLTNEEYEELLSKTEKLAKYWYDRPVSSLLDVGIGIAIDIALRNGQIDIDTLVNKDAEINTMYDADVLMEKTESISSSEADAVEQKYNLKSDKGSESTARNDIKSRDIIGGDIFDLYGDGGAYDFVSDKLAELEKKHGVDRISELLSSDKFTQDAYESEYDPTKPLDMSQVDNNGLLDIYGSDNHNVFDDLDKKDTSDDDVEDDTGENSVDSLAEDGYGFSDSVNEALADIIGYEEDGYEGDDYTEDESFYGENEIDAADLGENINDDDDEGV